MSIKIIKNIFFDKEKVDESKVKVEVEIPKEPKKEEKSKEEIFNEAVKEVFFEKICESVKKDLTESCYTPEQVRQTKEAQKALRKRLDEEGCPSGGYHSFMTDIKKDYPEAVTEHSISGSQFGMRFGFDLFVKKIVKESLDNEEW